MSQEISDEAPQKAAGANAKAEAEITKIDGEWSINLRISPPLQRQQQGSGQQAGGDTAVQEMNLSFHGFLGRRPQDDDDSEGAQRDGWFKEMLGWLMVVATVAASVTYQAGLNPPGGFRQDANDKSHRAGDPALHDERHVRYMVFYYFNGTAFVMSLVIMVLLMSERFYQTEAKVFALLLTTFLDLTSLIGAYMAGSTRCFSSCIYIIVITCVAFVVVIYIGEGVVQICWFLMIKFPCMKTLVSKKWFPIPKEVVEKQRRWLRGSGAMPREAAQHRSLLPVLRVALSKLAPRHNSGRIERASIY